VEASDTTAKKIIRLLMNDMSDLTTTVKDQKEMNEKLSKQIAKKISQTDTIKRVCMKSGLKPTQAHDEPITGYRHESGPNRNH